MGSVLQRQKALANSPVQLTQEGGSSKQAPGFSLESSPMQLQEASGPTKTPKQEALDKVTAFEANSSSGQAWTNISKADFIKDLRTRINNPGGLNQNSLNACGPAAAMVLMAQDDIVAFTEFLITLYTDGKASLGSTTVDPWDGILSRAPGDAEWGNYTENNLADYIVLGSLRSSQSMFFDQFEDPSDQFSGITLPGTVENWLNATGSYSSVEDDTSIFGKSYDHFKDTMVDKHKNGHRVVMLIGADMITISRGNATSKKSIKKDQAKKGKVGAKSQTSMPNHYVVYKGGFKESGDNVEFDMWTWGSTEHIVISKTDFARLYYGGIYAK